MTTRLALMTQRSVVQILPPSPRNHVNKRPGETLAVLFFDEKD